jgi:hypothetical protein
MLIAMCAVCTEVSLDPSARKRLGFDKDSDIAIVTKGAENEGIHPTLSPLLYK